MTSLGSDIVITRKILDSLLRGGKVRGREGFYITEGLQELYGVEGWMW